MNERNCNVSLVDSDGSWRVMFCLDYEDQAIKFYLTMTEASSAIYDWCSNGRLPQ